MSDFSRSPLELLLENLAKGYIGLHIEQGVPILDRDLNLLQDLLAADMRQLFSRYIGNGLASDAGDGFGIQALPAGQDKNDFRITGPGSCLAGGIEARIAAATSYRQQPFGGPAPELTAPTEAQPDPRTDIVYLQVFLAEVDGLGDVSLGNSEDVGMQTSVRLKPEWTVRVAEGVPVPGPEPGHIHYPLAQLRRRRGEDSITAGTFVLAGTTLERISDLRQRRLTLSHLETRLSLLERVLIAPTFAQDRPLRPLTGQVHQQITLAGNNFDKGSIEVFFDDIQAPVAATLSSSEIVVLVPGGLTPDGTGRSVRITVANEVASAVCEKLFGVRAGPVFASPPDPQFSPASGMAGTEVLLSGFNFNATGLTVLFGGKKGNVVGEPANTSLKVQVPDGLAANSLVKIKVQTSQGEAESTDDFRVGPPPPVITSFTPPSAAVGDPVILHGQNFDVPPVRVFFTVEGFDPVRAGLANPATADQITVETPELIFGAEPQRQARITVSTGAGSAVSAGLITVSQA
ncbi:IPT/TIG domain-containing protein [Arthrobacter sp. I2-34]|uniref:IPT/TIG domain-containing protein n=1 Tax=Arthrobacter hankyongi TaxID=2904801 RepID=A0ABS9L6X0_9MICC|nr:IPT/TIG domain-containing protein [Arthrobacter hankyongi]MCG2622420.1 IPT/TIG domain-containing protein [Arthrobacter hankyongi]